MLYIGRFTEEELNEEENRQRIGRLQMITGAKHIQTEEVKDGQKVVALDIYLRG